MAVHGDTRSVNLKRSVLLEKLKENLEIHKKDYEEAIEGYKVKLLLDMKNKIEEIEKTDPNRIQELEYVPFSPPRSYESSYLDVIEMLEFSVDDVINIDASSFKNYVKNEWAWSNNFKATTTLYKSYQVGSSK